MSALVRLLFLLFVSFLLLLVCTCSHLPYFYGFPVILVIVVVPLAARVDQLELVVWVGFLHQFRIKLHLLTVFLDT